jgi:hypothetical protein
MFLNFFWFNTLRLVAKNRGCKRFIPPIHKDFKPNSLLKVSPQSCGVLNPFDANKTAARR